MSKDLSHVLAELISILEGEGLVDISTLMRKLGFSESVVVTLRGRRMNYSQVAEYLKNFYNVFIPCSRKRAWYCCKVLKNKYGLNVNYARTDVDGEKGFVFWVKEE